MSKDATTIISDVFYTGNGIVFSEPELDYVDRISVVEYAKAGHHLEPILTFLGKRVWGLATDVTENVNNQIGFRLTIKIEPIDKPLT